MSKIDHPEYYKSGGVLREIVDHVAGVYEKLAKLAGEWQESINRGAENE